MSNARRLSSSLLFAGLVSASLAACDDKGAEDDSFDNYEEKSDSFRSPTQHGTLVFGVPQPAALVAGELFHAWDFSLSGDATVELETELITANLDTVMYLYMKDPETGLFGAFKFKNDDADDDTVASALNQDLAKGDYRVLVKGFKSKLRGNFRLSANCSGAGCEVGSCVLDRFAPLPDSSAPFCGELISAALNGTTESTNGTSVTLDERCSLPEEARVATEYYFSYWEGLVGFEDQFQFDPDEPVVLDVEWTEYSNGTTNVRVDAGGDEAAMDFLINSAGDLVAHYQHNQSPDFNLYCEGGVGFDDSECGFLYLESMPHEGDELTGSMQVTGADAATRLDRASLQAYEAYVRELGLADSVSVTVDFETWENPFSSSSWDTAGRVSVKASGEDRFVYELAAATTTQWQFNIKRGAAKRAFDCREL